jgi:hypothetical protein
MRRLLYRSTPRVVVTSRVRPDVTTTARPGGQSPSEATNGRHIEVSALLDIDQPTHRNNGRSGLRPSDSPKGGCVEGTSARRVAGSASRTTDTYNCRLVYPSRGRYVGGSLHRVSDPHTGRGAIRRVLAGSRRRNQGPRGSATCARETSAFEFGRPVKWSWGQVDEAS